MRPGGTLVVGSGLHPDALAVAERVCAERGARLVLAPADPRRPGARRGRATSGATSRSRAAAAQAFLGTLDAEAVAAAAAQTAVPGRFEIVDEAPVTVFDGAHNPDGMREPRRGAARRSWTAAGSSRCVSVLDDKDAAAMLGELGAAVQRADRHARREPARRCRRRRSSRWRASSAARRRRASIAEPHDALAAAREAAGPDGVVLVTGSLYLIADLLRPRGTRGSML